MVAIKERNRTNVDHVRSVTKLYTLQHNILVNIIQTAQYLEVSYINSVWALFPAFLVNFYSIFFKLSCFYYNHVRSVTKITKFGTPNEDNHMLYPCIIAFGLCFPCVGQCMTAFSSL